jgi:hypothetical protein
MYNQNMPTITKYLSLMGAYAPSQPHIFVA